MFKQLVVLSSLLVGTGSAGVAMYLQSDPLAFSQRKHVNLNTYLYAAKAEPVPASREATPPQVREPEPGRVVELPEVIVTRAKPAFAPAGSIGTPLREDPAFQMPATPVSPSDVAPSDTPRELHPCSRFREIGPMHVDEGVPSGARGVRDLC